MVLTVVIFLLLFQPSLEDNNMLDITLYSVESLVNYYKDNFAYMNLDGIYGLRILEGQFTTLLQNRADFNISEKYYVKIKHLLDLSSKIAETSMKHVQASDPEYFRQLSPIIDQPMKFVASYRRVNQYLKWSRSDLKAKGFDEPFSDKCMAELVERKDGQSVCHVSDQCLAAMFETGHQEYTILHQILYIMLATQHDCTAVLESYLSGEGYKGGLNGIVEEFCSNTLFEVVDLLYELTENNIPDIYQDLFLEQQFVCPSQGYMEFLHVDWLRQILSWQKPNGCYGDTTTKSPATLPPLGQLPPKQPSHDIVVQAGDSGQKLVYKRLNTSDKEAEAVRNHPLNYPFVEEPVIKFAKRKLLEERVLNDGCLSHRSAVAAGSLSQYIKFFLNPGPAEYQKHVGINGVNYLLYKTWYSVAFNNNPPGGHQMEPVDKPIDKNRQLKNYRLGRAASDDKEEVYQNQVNIPQPMYLGQNDNYNKKYDDSYDKENDDPHGYYDDEEEDREDIQQNEENVLEARPDLIEGWGNGIRKGLGGLDFDRPGEKNSREEERLRDNIIDLNIFEHEKNDDDNDPGYSYYDEAEKPNLGPRDKKLDLGEERLILDHFQQTSTSNLTLIQSYFILLVAMIALLAFMYRFVRKRRIVIKYR